MNLSFLNLSFLLMSLGLMSLLGLTGLGCAAALGGESDEIDTGRIRLEHDQDAFITSIYITGQGGRIAWSDIFLGFARARGYNDTELAGVIPNVSFDIRSVWSRLVIVALNEFSRPQIQFGIDRSGDQGGDHAVGAGDTRLVIRMNQEALLESRRKFKRRVSGMLRKSRLASGDPQQHIRYGLKLEDGWAAKPPEKPLLVTIHGFHSNPEEVTRMLDLPRTSGYPCGEFAYPNDVPIADSAKRLSAELMQLAVDHPGRKIALVTHSMGGLVARAALETPGLDAGNVSHLMMVAPPNQGSALARFAFAMDLWEMLQDDSRRKEVGGFYGAIEDGLAAAARDLRPGSVFLTELNERPRNPDVKYTILLGTQGILRPGDLEQVQARMNRLGQSNRWLRFFGSRLDGMLNDLDELVEGTGDGVVSLERGRLAGVDDVVVLRFNHLGVMSSQEVDSKAVHRVILDRIGK